LHQAGEECAGGDRLAEGVEEVNRTGGKRKARTPNAETPFAENAQGKLRAQKKSGEVGMGKIEKRN
jgi:hypothetical protein